MMERLGVATVQPREDLGYHRDGDPGRRAVAEIQTNRTAHLHWGVNVAFDCQLGPCTFIAI